MIFKELFLPDSINNYYFFTKRILGIDIGKTQVCITQILLSGTNSIVEKNITEPIELGSNGNGERTSIALKRAVEQCDSFNEIRTSLSSSHVIFKELRLPFTTRGKIEKVIGFEVEPLLPFALDGATIDFIITSIDQEQNNAQVLIAAVQKQYIAQHLQLFEQAGLTPDIITVDLFAIYSAYTMSSEAQSEGIVALIDAGFMSTRIACIHNKQLRTIRTINKGTFFIVKALSEAMNISPAQAFEYILRFGLKETDNPVYHKTVHTALSQLWGDVNFTLNSFAYQMKETKGIEHIFLFGGEAQIRGIDEFVTAKLNAPCKQLDGALFESTPHLSFKNKLFVGTNSILSFSTALPTNYIQNFNLLSEELSSKEETLFTKQIFVTAFLSICFLAVITSYTFIQTSRFSNQVASAEKEAIKALNEQFPDISSRNLIDAQDEALAEVEKEEKTWFAFSNKVRSSYLKYLLELHNKIDKRAIGLDLDKINIAENTINLRGHVENFDAFRSLRKTLRESDLFGPPEAKEERDFTMTIPIISAEEE